MAEFHWRKTNAPVASSRTDDIFFVGPNMGWAVNSNGQILKTSDGGYHWDEQKRLSGVYLRCAGFANPQTGWVGALTADQKLWSTVDGGATWNRVGNLPPSPNAICGLSVVNESVVFASGTNYPNRPPGVIRTTDGGQNWTAIDMRPYADLLVDIYFKDSQRGWVVGGKAEAGNPSRSNVKAVVLYTDNGGQSWTNTAQSISATLPKGEWGWKIFFVNETVGYVSLENFNDGAVLKTIDGGRSWNRLPVNDQQHNANLEGVGFVDEQQGWVGGWGTKDFSGGFSSATSDGGANWSNADGIGRFLNRFRFFHQPKLVGYASGDTVYRYDDSAPPAALAAAAAELPILASKGLVEIPYAVMDGDTNLRIDVWDRFGEHVAGLLNDPAPKPGEGLATYPASPGIYIYRISSDRSAESRVVRVE